MTIVAPLFAAAIKHSRQSVGVGDSGRAAAAAATATPVLAWPSPSSLSEEFDCDAMSVAPHAVRIPSTAVFRPSIACGIRRPNTSGKIGNVPLHCGHATKCPTPEMGLPSSVAVELPSSTFPPCDVVSPTQIMLRDTRPSLSAILSELYHWLGEKCREEVFLDTKECQMPSRTRKFRLANVRSHQQASFCYPAALPCLTHCAPFVEQVLCERVATTAAEHKQSCK